ncbi:MAG: thioredoxin family protein, partial [Rhodospirillales bacterium]|nr:thioredoxin family protein [Rhodospirillales bacterium]
MQFTDGLHLVVKKDCPTCTLIEPIIRDMAAVGESLSIYVQDDLSFLGDLPITEDDTTLEQSYHLDIETVPTMIRMEDGIEVERIVGWSQEDWQTFTGIDDIGKQLVPFQPGCGALNVSPGAEELLQAKFGRVPMKSRTIEVGRFDDEIEQMFDRGWSDGLPVVPPTPERVLRMLTGTPRDP